MSIYTTIQTAIAATLAEVTAAGKINTIDPNAISSEQALKNYCVSSGKLAACFIARNGGFRNSVLKSTVAGTPALVEKEHRFEILFLYGRQKEESKDAFQEGLDAIAEHFEAATTIARFAALNLIPLPPEVDRTTNRGKMQGAAVHAALLRLTVKETRNPKR